MTNLELFCVAFAFTFLGLLVIVLAVGWLGDTVMIVQVER